MNKNEEILRTLKIEEYIWVIYLIIIGLSFYSNNVERKYYQKHDLKAKEEYRMLNILIFSIALGVYYYFFQDGYKSVKNLTPWDSDSKKFFNKASFTASSLILISGCIFLFIAIFDANLETELAFS